ncbi:RodZ family helix-turn-helix domain-containing protein [uncultured Limosilactobacillus sp.]|uniref:helix-turn-helix domain-containing protein n=1 Tax=uncultured Limosilactobacillus sp. TaxID=2837629 RepID=UPI00265E255B|nr:RodZ domain-containing protein [uncultured Limosilactobacillus sp.]
MSENENDQKRLEIGKILRKAREEKGYTLDDLQQMTKIQKRYLIAIEDENFDELPGDFYVRAFIKQYANMVGLDGNELLQKYDDQLPKTKTEEYSDHLAQAVETRASQRKTVSGSVDKVRNYMPTIIIACVIVLVLAAIWLTAIARNHRDSSTRIDNSSVSVSGESRKKASSSSKKESTKQSKSTAIKLQEAPNRNDTSVTYTAKQLTADTTLQIEPSDRSWMQVRANNNNLLNKTLNNNEKTSLKINRDTTSLVITVGNARATKLKIGNQEIDFTNNGRYQNTRNVTINFGQNQSSSSAASQASNNSNRNASSTSQSNNATQPSAASSSRPQTNASRQGSQPTR